VPHFPRFRALALFGRRSPQCVDSLVMPASENLHNRRLTQRSNYQPFARVRSVVNAQKESGNLSSRPKTGSGKTRDWKRIQEKPVEDTTARLSF